VVSTQLNPRRSRVLVVVDGAVPFHLLIPVTRVRVLQVRVELGDAEPAGARVRAVGCEWFVFLLPNTHALSRSKPPPHPTPESKDKDMHRERQGECRLGVEACTAAASFGAWQRQLGVGGAGWVTDRVLRATILLARGRRLPIEALRRVTAAGAHQAMSTVYSVLLIDCTCGCTLDRSWSDGEHRYSGTRSTE
jgi:hypothetical protein